MTNSSSSADSKGLATIDNNLEWVRLAQRVPVKIRLDIEDQQHLYPAGTTATVVITGANDRDPNQAPPIVKLLRRLREFG